MTISATPPISLSNVLAELRVTNPGRSLPISLGDSDVRALAGVPSGPVSLSHLLGKTSYIAMSGSVADVEDIDVITGSNHTAYVPIGVSFSGGLAPFSYAWTRLSGEGSVVAANAATTNAAFSVNRFAESGTVMSQVVRCQVTDATGAVLTASGTVTLTLE